jgi:hypothetical protein
MPKGTRRTEIRVGQRLIAHDGTPGYVALNTRGTRIYGAGDAFRVDWLDGDGEVEDSQYLTLQELADEGITSGRGVMPWAR